MAYFSLGIAIILTLSFLSAVTVISSVMRSSQITRQTEQHEMSLLVFTNGYKVQSHAKGHYYG